jgi:hypothetical protein
MIEALKELCGLFSNEINAIKKGEIDQRLNTTTSTHPTFTMFPVYLGPE